MLQNFTANLWGENVAFLEINFQLLWNRPYGFKTLTAIKWKRFWRTHCSFLLPRANWELDLVLEARHWHQGSTALPASFLDVPGKGLAGWTLDPPQAAEISAACFCAFYFTSGLCLNLWFLRTGFILLMVLSTMCTGSYNRVELSTGTRRNHGLAIHRRVYMMLPCFGRNLCDASVDEKTAARGRGCDCHCRPAWPFLELTHPFPRHRHSSDTYAKNYVLLQTVSEFTKIWCTHLSYYEFLQHFILLLLYLFTD